MNSCSVMETQAIGSPASVCVCVSSCVHGYVRMCARIWTFIQHILCTLRGWNVYFRQRWWINFEVALHIQRRFSIAGFWSKRAATGQSEAERGQCISSTRYFRARLRWALKMRMKILNWMPAWLDSQCSSWYIKVSRRCKSTWKAGSWEYWGVSRYQIPYW